MQRVITSLLIFVFAFFFFSVTNVSAKVITDQEGTVSIPKTEVVNDDLFIGAQTVDIAGTVNGDVFIGAQTVKITGTINGNLHVGANMLDISGTVKGNVYGGAQSVLVSGAKVGGSLLVGAATVDVDKDTTIAGSVLAGAGTLSIDSQIKRSVYAGAGSLTIGSDASIGKDLYYGSGDGQADISADAKIAGNVYKSEAKTATGSASVKAAKKQLPAALNALRIGATMISFVGAFIVGLLYLKLFSKHLSQSADLVSKSFWKSLGVGFLVLIASIPGLILLLITVIGIPLAGIAILILSLYSYLAKIVVGLALGSWISQKLKWKMASYGVIALGLFAFYVLKMIPVIGFAVGLVVLLSGLGALTLRVFQRS